MSTLYRTLILALAVCVAGCDRPAEPAAPPVATETRETAPPVGSDQRLARGEETYRSACAGCHDNGEHGAPRTGVREDWEGRSEMWQAVLFRHARDGYLDMPEKGGQPALSDDSVDAASEYMLEATFPDRPRD